MPKLAKRLQDSDHTFCRRGNETESLSRRVDTLIVVTTHAQRLGKNKHDQYIVSLLVMRRSRYYILTDGCLSELDSSNLGMARDVRRSTDRLVVCPSNDGALSDRGDSSTSDGGSGLVCNCVSSVIGFSIQHTHTDR